MHSCRRIYDTEVFEKLGRCVSAREAFFRLLKALSNADTTPLDEIDEETAAYPLPAYEDDTER